VTHIYGTRRLFKVFFATLALLAWIEIFYFSHQGNDIDLWVGIFVAPLLTWFWLRSSSLHYVLDGTGIQMAGRFGIRPRRFQWHEVEGITVDYLNPIPIPRVIPRFDMYILYTTNPQDPKGRKWLFMIPSVAIKRADHLLREICQRIPPTAHIDPKIRSIVDRTK